MDKPADWTLKGGYFETCNCVTSCPCIWLQPPSEDNCKLLVAWHIESGHFNDQSLDELNVALACYSPGNMKEGAWQAALYVDERANDLQFDAITQIFGGQQGGHLTILMSFVGEVLGIKKVRIDYQEQVANGNSSFPKSLRQILRQSKISREATQRSIIHLCAW